MQPETIFNERRKFMDFSAFWSAIPPIVKAILLLVLAFIVAAIVKSLVVKIIEKTKLDGVLAKADGEKPGSTKSFIGKLVYLLVFLLFIPGIFSALGVDSVAAPILGMLSKIWGYLPNVLGAVIVLIVGFLLARLVRSLLIPLFDRIKVDKLQEKFGIEVNDQNKLSYTLAYIVYVLILIPVIIIALQVLKISAVSDPAVEMLNIIFSYIPKIIGAALIIFIGVLIARFACQIVSRVIGATGVDAKIQGLMDGKMKNFIFSKTVGTVVRVLIIIFFVVESFSVLKLGILTQVGDAIIKYMPSVLAALIILIAAMVVSSLAEKALKKLGYNGFAAIAKIAIIVLAVFMILSQLSIAPKIVNIAFFMVMAALAVAFAISFGVGGREFAASVLKDAKNKYDAEKEAAAAAEPECECAPECEAEAPVEEAVEAAEEAEEKAEGIQAAAKTVFDSAKEALSDEEQ